MGLAKKTVEGTVWAVVAYGGGKLLVMISSVILARLLTPAEFGLVGMALVAINFLSFIEGMGVGAAIIYKTEDIDKVANTAFYLSGAIGILLLVVTYFVSPSVALFFETPEVEPLLQLLSLSFIIKAFGNTHDSLLQKELEFKKKLAPDLARAFVRGIISIVLAWLGWGVWSLAWGQVVGNLASTVAAWMVLPWRPSLSFSLKLARELFSYGTQIVINSFLAVIGAQVDYLFVGKMLGEVALGVYTLAFKIPELLIMTIMTITSKVIFPAYSKLKDRPDALQRSFMITVQFISLLAFPAGAGLYMLSPDLVDVFYTAKWEAAVPMMQILALYAAVRIIGWSGTGSIYKAMGRPDLLSKTGIIKTVLLFPGLWWGVSMYGAVGAAWAQFLISIIHGLVNLYIAHRMLGIRFSALIGEMKTAVISTIIMLIALILFFNFAPPMSSLLRLILSSTMGAIVYLGCVWLIGKETVLLARKLAGFVPTVSK